MMQPHFETERQLVDSLLHSDQLRTLHDFPGWETWEAQELEGLAGRPDFVLGYARVDKIGRIRVTAVSFEMKLVDWKRALSQAYRYSTFTNYSYVVMDHCRITPAVQSIELFKRSGIGLLSYSQSSGLHTHVRARFHAPYSTYLSRKLRSWIAEAVIAEAAFPSRHH